MYIRTDVCTNQNIYEHFEKTFLLKDRKMLPSGFETLRGICFGESFPWSEQQNVKKK